MNWPNDADGDVFRRMEAGGFDFDEPCAIDFNVDFDRWPPPETAIAALKERYPSVKIYDAAEGYPGYIKFHVFQKLSYDLVISTQASVSELMAPYHGICESWGVLH